MVNWHIITENGPGKFDTKQDCDWSRSIGDSQESPCLATKQTMTKSGQFSIQVMYTSINNMQLLSLK